LKAIYLFIELRQRFCVFSVAYKLSPEMMEFYYAWDQLIADRIRYKKNERNENHWEYQRIAA